MSQMQTQPDADGPAQGETDRPGGRGLPGRFIGVLAGTASSGLGDGMVMTAFPLLVLSFTDRPILVAGVTIAMGAPKLLLSLHGGALVDRSSLSRLLGRIDLVRAAVVGLLAVLVAREAPADVILPMVYATAFAVGTGDVMVKAGVQRAIPLMLRDDQLEGANSAKHAAEDLTDTMIGPALGGILFTIGAAIPFGVDAMTYLISAVVFLRLLPATPRPADTEGQNLTAAAMSGLRWLREQPDLLAHVATIATFAMLQAGAMAILPLLPAAMAFEGRALGFLYAGGSVTAVGVSFVAARLIRRRDIGRILAVAGGVSGIGYLLLGLSDSFVLGLLGMAIEGFAVTTALIASVTWRQRRIPNELIGRVFATTGLLIGLAVVVGALVSGLVATAITASPTVALIGGVQVLVPALLVGLQRRRPAGSSSGQPPTAT